MHVLEECPRKSERFTVQKQESGTVSPQLACRQHPLEETLMCLK